MFDEIEGVFCVGSEAYLDDWFVEEMCKGRIITHSNRPEGEFSDPFDYYPITYCDVLAVEGWGKAKTGDRIIKRANGLYIES